jgi:hypothetical protein
MTNHEAIMKMTPDELALFLGKVFCQGEIYGELLRSDYYGNELITEDKLHEQTVKSHAKNYVKFLKQENESDIVRVPNIKY